MADENQTNGAEGEKPFTLDSIEKRYFAPSDFEAAQHYGGLVTKAVAEAEADGAIDANSLRMNWKPQSDGGEGIPEGFGLLIMPIQKRVKDANGEGKNVPVGAGIFAIPDPSLVASSEKGADYIRNALIDDFGNRLANAVRPRGEEAKTAVTLPTSLDHFLERGRRGESLKSFAEIAPDFVKAFKKLGIKHMSNVLLRQCLQSAEFAAEALPKTKQEVWEKTLQKMISSASTKGLDPAVFIHWRDTRDQTESEAADEFDFDDLLGEMETA